MKNVFRASAAREVGPRILVQLKRQSRGMVIEPGTARGTPLAAQRGQRPVSACAAVEPQQLVTKIGIPRSGDHRANPVNESERTDSLPLRASPHLHHTSTSRAKLAPVGDRRRTRRTIAPMKPSMMPYIKAPAIALTRPELVSGGVYA